jgi:hypothetical protein
MKHLRSLTVFCFSIALTSCVTTYIAPGFAEHEARVLVSPSPNAIVGMWVVKPDPALNSRSIRSTSAYCFKSDGTGYFRSATDGYTPSQAQYFTKDRKVQNITWKYDGSGFWTASQPQEGGYPDIPVRLRTDGKVLMFYLDYGGVMGVTTRTVLTRMSSGE